MKPLSIATAALLIFGPSSLPARAGSPSCLDAPYRTTGTEAGADQRRLAELMAELRVALTDFPALIAVLDRRQPQLCLMDGLIVAKAFYEPEDNRIVLASGMEPGLMHAVLVHEIRHLYQDTYGICPSDTLAMQHYARAVFAMEADANVVGLLVAWHLRAAGDSRMWRALEDWPMTADIAARFATVMAATRDVAAAAAAAFDQWYTSDTRREQYYVAACSDYLDRIDRTHAFPGYRDLPADFLERLCQMPDGGAYDCNEAENALER